MPRKVTIKTWEDGECTGVSTPDGRAGFWRDADCPLPAEMNAALKEWCRETDRYCDIWASDDKKAAIDVSYWHTEMANVGVLATAHARVGDIALCEAYTERRRADGSENGNGRSDLYIFMPTKEDETEGPELLIEAKWAKPITKDGSTGFDGKEVLSAWDDARNDARTLPLGTGAKRVALLFVTPRITRLDDWNEKTFKTFWDNLELDRCTTLAWWRTPKGRDPAFDGECYWPGVIACFGIMKYGKPVSQH